MKPVLQKTINSLVWIVSGIIVITLRVLIIRSVSIFLWEGLGLIMIAYGAAKLLWLLAGGAFTQRSVP